MFWLYRPDPYLGRLKELFDASGGAASDVDPETISQPEVTLFCVSALRGSLEYYECKIGTECTVRSME